MEETEYLNLIELEELQDQTSLNLEGHKRLLSLVEKFRNITNTQLYLYSVEGERKN